MTQTSGGRELDDLPRRRTEQDGHSEEATRDKELEDALRQVAAVTVISNDHDESLSHVPQTTAQMILSIFMAPI